MNQCFNTNIWHLMKMNEWWSQLHISHLAFTQSCLFLSASSRCYKMWQNTFRVNYGNETMINGAAINTSENFIYIPLHPREKVPLLLIQSSEAIKFIKGGIFCTFIVWKGSVAQVGCFKLVRNCKLTSLFYYILNINSYKTLDSLQPDLSTGDINQYRQLNLSHDSTFHVNVYI